MSPEAEKFKILRFFIRLASRHTAPTDALSLWYSTRKIRMHMQSEAIGLMIQPKISMHNTSDKTLLSWSQLLR